VNSTARPTPIRQEKSAALVDFFVDQTIRLNPRHHAAQALTDVFDGVL
jgi:hypothetical protein